MGNTLPDATEIVPRTLWRRLRHASRRKIDALLLWQDRRGQRRALAMLGDDILKDIGVSRLEAEHESIKRPWSE